MGKYVITGGPCTGKTHLLLHLEEKGYTVVEEAARAVIKEEIEKEKLLAGYKPIVPWKNFPGFQEAVKRKQVGLESRITGGIAFLDRSLIDNIAYARIHNVKINEDIYGYIEKASYTKIFFMDRLGFYGQDAERKETEEEAKVIHEAIYKAYCDMGFDPVIVPAIGSRKRAEFVLGRIR